MLIIVFDFNKWLYRGRASRWPEATQTAVGPAKAIFWLAPLASHNFCTSINFIFVLISVDIQ